MLPPPDPGRSTVRSGVPRRDESGVQISGPTEVVLPAKSTVKVPEISPIPSPGIASISDHRPAPILTPLDSSPRGDLLVQKSAQTEFVCPPKSTGEVPSRIFPAPTNFSSPIAATSGILSPIRTPIWNAHDQTSSVVPSIASSESGAGGNFRSTLALFETLAAPPSNVDASAVAASKLNSFGQDTPQGMGNTMVSSISVNSSAIKNAQIGGFDSISSPISPELGLNLAGSRGLVAGSEVPSCSPAGGGAPVVAVRVDSVESNIQIGRVNSAATFVFKGDQGVHAGVSVGPVPPKVSFRDILRRESSSSSAHGFGDVLDSMDDVPAPTDRDGVPGILFPDQVISSLSVPFRYALVGRISGNRGLTPNKDILAALSCTGLLGSHTVRFLPRGYMVLTLSCEEDYLKFWERPEVSIRTVVIRFSKWTPEFKFEEDSSIAPVWVRFPDLPLHLYNKKSLYPIAKILGNPIKVDEITADGSRGSFARVCIEMDVLQSRQDKVWVGWGDHFQFVEVIYERVPHFCSHCKMIGHSLDVCSSIGQRFRTMRRGNQRPTAPAPQSSDQQPQDTRPHGKGVVSDSPLPAPSLSTQGLSSDLVQSSDSDFPEQVVKRPRRRPVVKKDPNRPISNKNYFEVLQDLPSGSGPGESSGSVKPRTHRVKSLLSKLAVEGNAEAGYPYQPVSTRISSDQNTPMVDVVASSVTAVSVPVDVPGQVAEIALTVPDPVCDSSVSIPLPVDTPGSIVFPEFAIGKVSMGGEEVVVPSSPNTGLSLPLLGRTRSQQRRYYRQKAAQASLPYGRPSVPG